MAVVTEDHTALGQLLFKKQMNVARQPCNSVLQPFGRELPVGLGLCEFSRFGHPGKYVMLRTLIIHRPNKIIFLPNA